MPFRRREPTSKNLPKRYEADFGLTFVECVLADAWFKLKGEPSPLAEVLESLKFEPAGRLGQLLIPLDDETLLKVSKCNILEALAFLRSRADEVFQVA